MAGSVEERVITRQVPVDLSRENADTRVSIYPLSVRELPLI